MGTDCPELHEGSSHTQSTAEWAEKKKKVTGRGSRWALGQQPSWADLRVGGSGNAQGRREAGTKHAARTKLCFRKDQALAPVSSVALSSQSSHGGCAHSHSQWSLPAAERPPRLEVSPELCRLVENLRSEQVPTRKL